MRPLFGLSPTITSTTDPYPTAMADSRQAPLSIDFAIVGGSMFSKRRPVRVLTIPRHCRIGLCVFPGQCRAPSPRLRKACRSADGASHFLPPPRPIASEHHLQITQDSAGIRVPPNLDRPLREWGLGAKLDFHAHKTARTDCFHCVCFLPRVRPEPSYP